LLWFFKRRAKNRQFDQTGEGTRAPLRRLPYLLARAL
jgi:hypothetical protein